MPTLSIKHIATYQYRQPVAFGEHRMMLRPRDGYDQGLIEAKLVITPTPISIRRTQDAFGNHLISRNPLGPIPSALPIRL
jgi:hypothetical protein